MKTARCVAAFALVGLSAALLTSCVASQAGTTSDGQAIDLASPVAVATVQAITGAQPSTVTPQREATPPPAGIKEYNPGPPVPPWGKQAGKWKDQNDQGNFSVIAVEGGSRELLFFYSFKGSGHGVPEIQAVSTLKSGSGSGEEPLHVTQVQPLGTLAEHDVGVAHVVPIDRPGQAVELRVTAPGGSEPAWQAAPVKQEGAFGKVETGQLMMDEPAGIGEVGIACPCGPRAFKLALFGRSPTQVPIIFVGVDGNLNVNVLSQEQYEGLVRPGGNGPPMPPTEDVEHPHFAPTYPPTATP